MATDNQVNIEDLSDDEILKLGPEGLAKLNGGEVTSTTGEGDDTAQGGDANDEGRDLAAEEEARRAEEEAAAVAAAANANKGDDDGKQDDGKAAPNGATDGAQAGKGDDGAATGEAAGKAAPAADGKAKVDDKATETGAVDFAAEHKKLLAPFKANGRDIQVASVDEARQLMQMGANYNKKMQGLKPKLNVLRTLENAQIGEAELNFLIDLHRRDPAAINKLVNDSKIDPMDLSAEKAADYRPGNHRASDAEVELEAVMSEIEGSAGFDRTIDVVTKALDPASKKVVAANPAIIKVLNGHVENGVYDLVSGELERQQMLGQLTGLSYLEAYRQVADAMNASGKFAHLEAGQPPKGQQTPAAPVVAAANPKKADDSKRDAARRAVAPVKSAANSGKKNDPDFNPLSLSDEDFAKQFAGGKF
jgi:hypothetical protein